MKKMGILIITILVLIAVVGLGYYLIYKPHMKGKRAEQKTEIEQLYFHQNHAFGMGLAPSYLDYNKINKNRLIERLAAYEDSGQAKAEVSLDDIKQYLSGEYDESGKLAAENRPENIEAYIDWAWSDDGEKYIKDYIQWITNYQLDHTDKYSEESIDKLSEDKLLELIDDFKNCDDKDQYKR
ncbi:hypothetical protein D6856_13955 [Butyrivibrio sp. XB500-5]|uniref:hypothetical protein n=1 Tax=Butyrivibrio sp. XB500-5 TaxID=2364880 RepID=UPI000EA8D8E8|nr:hypothetical protein [Butyrivibrio sp. XB500-5]RKM57755.1 hypothetical protein D6856_13955 [Butyrivibrio sp. XB500-5]